ncbi:COG1361 S-layer family protein [Candidatus Pacearchaeota archaeon]|nr:COG1361 S-layer family protein [Candidatus Pacearchaeota archaeon]
MNFKLIFTIMFSVFLIGGVNAIFCVTAEISDITPSSIGIGEEFTVGIQIENCGTETPANIYFELLNPPTDITIKEPLILEIPELNYGNSERFLTYHMRTNNDALPGTHVIKTRLSYGDVVRDYNITFDVIGDGAELSIASLKTNPILPREGETVELTLRIENTGDGTAKSVEVFVDHPFQGLKQSFIGALDADEDGPAVLTFIVDDDGEFEFPITVSYYDDFGKDEIKTNVNLNVLKKEYNIGAIIFTILIIAIFAWGIYYFRKTKKAKDRTIHQLLQGENFDSELKETPKKPLKKSLRKFSETKTEREKKERRREEFKREILEKYKK